MSYFDIWCVSERLKCTSFVLIHARIVYLFENVYQAILSVFSSLSFSVAIDLITHLTLMHSVSLILNLMKNFIRAATTSKWIIFSGWKNRWLIRFCEIMHKINHEAAIKMSCIMWIVVAAMKISYSTFEPI